MCFLLLVSQEKCQSNSEFDVSDDRLLAHNKSEKEEKNDWPSSNWDGWKISTWQNRSRGRIIF